ncbi:radical SAM protein [Candidatus Woesearchaeota archaeon]|nr:radical SAM protein [Candidatus Woesearchaeota archaeon]
MAELRFDDFAFAEDSADHALLRVRFLDIFYFPLLKEDLAKIGDFSLDEQDAHKILFPYESQARAERKFKMLLPKGFVQLRSGLNQNPTLYVHSNSGIPLIGSLAFGIVDRGTNIVEVKPITGCNLNCTFCSVDEGSSTRKKTDIVVEKDYLIDELRKLLEYKGDVKIDVYINTHGEPTLYADLEGLIAGIRRLPQVAKIALITNGTMLNEPRINAFIAAGLTQLDLSINALSHEKAKELAGTNVYNIEHIKRIARYAASKLHLILAPVWLQGINDNEIEKIIAFAKEIGATVGIQNFLNYAPGRNPTKELPMEDFFKKLQELGKKYAVELVRRDHTVFSTREYPKPFKRGDCVSAIIVARGRIGQERLAVAEGRVIAVNGTNKDAGTVRVKIVRDKNNIFIGTAL